MYQIRSYGPKENKKKSKDNKDSNNIDHDNTKHIHLQMKFVKLNKTYIDAIF